VVLDKLYLVFLNRLWAPVLTKEYTDEPQVIKENTTKMSKGFKILCYDESERLNEEGSNWTFWKTQIIPYLKGSRLWPYISGTMPKPAVTDIDKLAKWEEVDAQALSMILMNIIPKRTSRSRLLICESCMGWVVKLFTHK